MYKITSQIEGQIQEIVFFVSLLLSFSVFLSGIFYLALSPESLTFILGQFGAAIDHGLFAAFGFAFFYFAVIALHMGYVTNFHVFNFKDLKREYPVLLYSFFAHVLILSLFSTLLNVFQVYLEIPSSESLAYGSGGFIGSVFGPHLYSALGIYGSVILLIAFKAAAAIAAGFFELHDVVVALKKTSHQTKKVTVKSAKTINASLLNGMHFFLKGNEMTEATANTSRWISQSINKANNLFTDHLHIYKREEAPVVEKAVKKEKTENKVKVVVKTTALKKEKSASSKIMKNLKDIKKISGLQKRSIKKSGGKEVSAKRK